MTSDQSLSLSFPEPDIAVIRIDTPGRRVNLLSGNVLGELASMLDQLATRSNLAGLVFISAKPGTFVVGADLRIAASLVDGSAGDVVARSQGGQRILSRLSSCPFVTVSAIDGPCLGGGAELACWCDGRILSDRPETTIGFPEVNLGIIPGWGGTVRAPRLVGLGNAVQMLTSGQPIDADSALEMGLADAVVGREDLLQAAIEFACAERTERGYLAQREKHRQPMEIDDAELDYLGQTSRESIHRTAPQAIAAPMVALELLLDCARRETEDACHRESEAVSRLFGLPVHRALLNVFLLRDRKKRAAGVSAPDSASRIESVGIIGAGLMGVGIAAANLNAEIPVVITDASPSVLSNATPSILEQTDASDSDHVAAAAARLTIAEHEVDVAACDLVIETVVETMDVKRRIYERLEPKLKEDAVLVSNTSTLRIAKLAEGLGRPKRFCGLHFFNPIDKMELAEVIRGPQTSESTIARVVDYAHRLGKMPIVVNDGPGFLVNRLLSAYLNEGHELLCAGVPIQDIDRAAESFGMRTGPMKFYDFVGINTAFLAGLSMWEAFPDRIGLLPVIPNMFKKGRLGRKSGSGFYRYESPDGPALPDPDVGQYIDPYIRERIEIGLEEIQNRIFLAVLLEATRVLESGIVQDVRDIDTGIVFGLGFPRYRGGILFWGDTLGPQRILEMVRPLEALGARFHPPDLLVDMAADGRKFYDAVGPWIGS
jgi:3-hydroxyacyl-CoA dehydrogenase/enoyl-CoA hydratase/3-hydroxybutyryl-CoA epimerase/3-hydroxyacyl-CoA dehydrogenase/enoyl-CoA hydratase/3-hydroxybutyryl-CoA epimerase/enoyl-CoA isomerase